MRIWIFGFSGDDQKRLDGLLGTLDLGPAVVIPPNAGATTLRDLFAGRLAPGAPVARAAQLVLFEDLPHADIGRVIDRYQAAAWPEPLWAAVTETTLTWPFARLIDALAAEHEALQRSRTYDGD